jgi:hypothetical protein
MERCLERCFVGAISGPGWIRRLPAALVAPNLTSIPQPEIRGHAHPTLWIPILIKRPTLRERIRPGLGIIEPCLPLPAKAPPPPKADTRVILNARGFGR